MRPPSTWITEPVTYDAASDARKQTTDAISSGRPRRWSGIALEILVGRPADLLDPLGVYAAGGDRVDGDLSGPSSCAIDFAHPTTPGRTALESARLSAGS